MTTTDLGSAFGHDPALISYVTAGDPDIDSTARHAQALVDGGSDVVELGLPFSEPIADGPTIQEAITRSLADGMTPDRYFDLVRNLDVDAPLVCMTYYNLIFQYGHRPGGESRDELAAIEPFVEAAAAAGIAGLIVPDLPVDESEALRQACDRHGVDLVFIVAPTTPANRLQEILNASSGFVYVQARLGTTGARTDVSEETYRSLARLPETDLPRAVGFGVSKRAHAKAIVDAGADGVVAGSVFVDIVAKGDSPEGTVAERLRRTATELKRGARAGTSITEGERP